MLITLLNGSYYRVALAEHLIGNYDSWISIQRAKILTSFSVHKYIYAYIHTLGLVWSLLLWNILTILKYLKHKENNFTSAQ